MLPREYEGNLIDVGNCDALRRRDWWNLPEKNSELWVATNREQSEGICKYEPITHKFGCLQRDQLVFPRSHTVVVSAKREGGVCGEFVSFCNLLVPSNGED
jgi:hypothetical protein